MKNNFWVLGIFAAVLAAAMFTGYYFDQSAKTPPPPSVAAKTPEAPTVHLSEPKPIPKPESNNQRLEAETALMEAILPLVQKGLIAVVAVEPKDEDGLAWVDPLLWRNYTHDRKYAILQGIGAFFSVNNTLKGSRLKGAAAMDKTSMQVLGLINLETGKITIKK